MVSSIVVQRQCKLCAESKALKDFKVGKRTLTRCQACRASTISRSRNGVSSHCNQYCPICRAGPFVVATTHITRIHGLTNKEVHERYGITSSQVFRDGVLERFAKGECVSMGPAAEQMHRSSASKHRRWLKVAREEQLKGGYWIVRCAKRWHISYAGACSRIHTLKSLGLLERVKLPALVCRKGHALTPENTYIDPRGTKRCRTCKQKSAA